MIFIFRRLRRMFETGHVMQFMKNDVQNATFCLSKPGSENLNQIQVLDIKDLTGVFMLLGFGKYRNMPKFSIQIIYFMFTGVLVGLIILFTEICTSR